MVYKFEKQEGRDTVRAAFSYDHEKIAKLHEFVQNFSIYKSNTLRFKESHGLVTIVPVQYSHSRDVHRG
jgi:hypothetical protein